MSGQRSGQAIPNPYSVTQVTRELADDREHGQKVVPCRPEATCVELWVGRPGEAVDPIRGRCTKPVGHPGHEHTCALGTWWGPPTRPEPTMLADHLRQKECMREQWEQIHGPSNTTITGPEQAAAFRYVMDLAEAAEQRRSEATVGGFEPFQDPYTGETLYRPRAEAKGDAAKGLDDHALAGMLEYLAAAIDRGLSPVVDEDLNRNIREARNRARWLRERAEQRSAAASPVAPNTHVARAAQQPSFRQQPDLRLLLTEHYLAGIDCDHEAKTDRARCACSMVALPVCPTVGAAVQSWIDHVLDEQRRAAAKGDPK